MHYPILPQMRRKQLNEGAVIPAHPLVLDRNRKLDEERQRRLTRYYLAAGVGGIAVGVHTTQFEIRNPVINLLEPVLRIASEEVERNSGDVKPLRVAGIVGPTALAIRDAESAVRHGYDLGLLSMGGLQSLSERELIARAEIISTIIPIFGFYLQPAAGGRILSYEFWQKLVEIPNVYAIKIAAFNRYQTLDVVRAVCNSDRRDEIALYTGNDDNIVADLLTTYRFPLNGKTVEKNFVGGLLGHWAAWTGKAVELLNEIKQAKAEKKDLRDLLTKSVAVTDMNAAIFDAKNNYRGCIPGIHEVLRRQGLLENIHTLNTGEVLSEGQAEEITRVCNYYPELIDDGFVKKFLN